MPGLFRGTVVVTEDGQGIAAHVIALLNQAGATAVHARDVRAIGPHTDPTTAPTDDPAGAAAATSPTATIFLGGLRPDTHTADDLDVTREAFRCARGVAGQGAFVTVNRLGRAGPGALARTCAREWSEVAVKSIELDPSDFASATGPVSAPDVASASAAAIVTELLTGDSEPDVVLGLDGSRCVRTMRPTPWTPRSRAPFNEESVVVITGGARGVTAACARALARAFRPRIALVGRTPLEDESPELADARSEPDLRAALVARAMRTGSKPRPAAIEGELRQVLAAREVRATLADIEAAGSPVRYVRADVGDVESLRSALDDVRGEWGAISGVVHGAGVLADRLVVDKTDEQFDRVLRVKAEGFKHLLELVADDDPGLICVFSSVAASAGNAGQTDYAAANEIAERLALDWRARHPACVVKAIAWGPWSGGMVSAELAAHFAERDVALIPLAVGAEAFIAEISGSAEITGPTGAERAHDASQVAADTDAGDDPDLGDDPDFSDDSDLDARATDGRVAPTDVPAAPADDAVRCLITAGTARDGVTFGAPSALPRAGELGVSEVAQVWLGSHRIGDRAVVPLAVVCDWMVRLVDAAGAGAPVVIQDLDVVRGIIAPTRVTVRRGGLGSPGLVGAPELAVVTEAGAVCYRARLAAGGSHAAVGSDGMAVGAASVLGLAPEAVGDAGAGDVAISEVYDGETLFHGSALRTLTRIDGISAGGAVGEVVGAVEMEWPVEPWRVDPAALDGAIQLAVLWAKARIGHATLPMGVWEARFAPGDPLPGALRCVVREVSVGDQSAVCDVWLGPAGGVGVAELRGLELVARPR